MAGTGPPRLRAADLFLTLSSLWAKLRAPPLCGDGAWLAISLANIPVLVRP
jgi:hypothetical protein